MAQYFKNFYSSTFYGRIKAFYGEYFTEHFDAQEAFSSKVNARIEARIPSSFYEGGSPEFIVVEDDKWNLVNGRYETSTAGAYLEANATGDSFEVHAVYQEGGNQNIEAILYKEVQSGDAYSWVEVERQTMNTLSVTKPGQVATLQLGRHGYADYKVRITVIDTTGKATIAGVKLETSHMTVELSASADNQTWSPWERLSIAPLSESGDQFVLTGESDTTYSNVRYVRAKIGLYTSDNNSTPIVDLLEFRSEDSGLYEVAGDYTAQVNMNIVAASAGSSTVFKKVDKIRFVESGKTEATELVVRSSSSRDNNFWGPVTAPYRADTKRLRLKRGVIGHSVVVGPIQENEKFEFVTTERLNEWDAEAFLPKNPASANVSYVFSKTRTDQKDPGNVLQEVVDGIKETNRSLTFNPQPYFLSVFLSRQNGQATPVVDMFQVDQEMRYLEEVHVTSQDVSAVDGENTGRKQLQRISDNAFTYPNASGETSFNQRQITEAEQAYTLEDKTGRPSDVILYLKSEEAKSLKTNRTGDASNEVVAKAIPRLLEKGDTSGVLKHYQYGAGEVQYLRPYDREAGSSYTPSLSDQQKYRYYVKNGWPAESHRVITGQTLSEVAEIHKVGEDDLLETNGQLVLNEDGTLLAGQDLKIPSYHENDKVLIRFKNGTFYSQQSSHNARIEQKRGAVVSDLSTEKLSVQVIDEPERGTVDWESEEKIYTGIINADDVRGEYIGTQYNRSSNAGFERSYTVQAGDTWASIAERYAVNEFVLKAANGEAVLREGETVIVPPNIMLPELAPEAEFEGRFPYEVSIVPDSVKKKDGTRVDESFVPIDWNGKRKPLKVTYRESGILTATLTRGEMLHGMDPLPLSDVTRIVSVKKGAFTYHEWNDVLQTGDFKLTSNYIDWSPAKAGEVEPEAGETYTVNYVRKEVDQVELFMDTTYFEKIGADIVWRSPEVKVFEGVCTPTEDYRTLLPKPEEFQGYSAAYQNVDYVIEDNDLWVETRMENEEGQAYLVGSLNGKDPSKNWHPTIQTGYYYLKEQEHYLYSEPLKTVLGDKELPSVKGVEYVNGPTGIGALLMPSGTNHVRDSEFATKTWRKSKIFPALPLTAADMWVLGISRL